MARAATSLTSADGSDWVERLARLGYLSRALIYGIVGLTAMRIASGNGGSSSSSSSRGALHEIAQHSFGTVLLLAVGIGLAGYALWRLIQTFTRRPDHDNAVARLVHRASYPVRGAIYGALSWSAFSIVLGSGSGGGSGGGGGSGLTATVMQWPGGRFLVAAVGLVIIGYGLKQAHRAVTQEFEEELKRHQMSARERRWISRLGTTGYAGRALAYGLVGGFVAIAALTADPDKAQGLDKALSELNGTAYGPLVIGAVGIGLFAFAAYSAAESRYRKIDVE